MKRILTARRRKDDGAPQSPQTDARTLHNTAGHSSFYGNQIVSNERSTQAQGMGRPVGETTAQHDLSGHYGETSQNDLPRSLSMNAAGKKNRSAVSLSKVTSSVTRTAGLKSAIQVAKGMREQPSNSARTITGQQPSRGMPSATTQRDAPRLSTPHADGELFRLGQLPATEPTPLSTILAASGRQVTLRKSDAVRATLFNTLTNMRDVVLLSRVTDDYIPYALTAWDIAEGLRARGSDIPVGFLWRSGLVPNDSAAKTYRGGFGFEAAMVVTLSGLNNLRNVLETARNFAMQEDTEQVAQIKSLQCAAGKFVYVRDEVAPRAFAMFEGEPPPEIIPQTATFLHDVALAVAQTLHVRRAFVNNMRQATLTKLAVAAREHVRRLSSTMMSCQRAGARLSPDFNVVIQELDWLTSAWSYLFAAHDFQTSAPKVAALRAAQSFLERAAQGRLVATVAREYFDGLQTQLDDAESENRAIFLDEIPQLAQVELPQGRFLASATPFDAPRIAKAETKPQNNQ